jgi:hypothetical protein
LRKSISLVLRVVKALGTKVCQFLAEEMPQSRLGREWLPQRFEKQILYSSLLHKTKEKT